MCDISLENVGGESCEPVGGLTVEVHIAPVKDFTLVQEPPALDGYETLESLVSVTTAHTFPAGKGFTTIEGVEETGTLKSTMIGNPGAQLFQNELVIEVAGSAAKLLGFLRVAKNLRFIALAEEGGSGNQRQLGSKRSPARFTGIEAAIEAAREGKNSVMLTIQDKQRWPAPIYTGAITLKPEPTP